MLSGTATGVRPRARRKPKKRDQAQLQRLRFLESLLVFEGFVSRSRLKKVFDVSENHISRDITRYRETHGDSLIYDVSEKRYRAAPGFRPALGDVSTGDYLALLRAGFDGADEIARTLPGPDRGATIPLHSGELELDLLKAITRAITHRTGLQVRYQSMRRPQPVVTDLWPHALVFSGSRWHARCFQREKELFRDFVLARLTVLKELDESEPRAAPERDVAWTRIIDVHVRPAKRLSESQQEAVAREYGMKGKPRSKLWKCSLKECLVPYFLQVHRLEHVTRQSRIELVDSTIAERYRFPDE